MNGPYLRICAKNLSSVYLFCDFPCAKNAKNAKRLYCLDFNASECILVNNENTGEIFGILSYKLFWSIFDLIRIFLRSLEQFIQAAEGQNNFGNIRNSSTC